MSDKVLRQFNRSAKGSYDVHARVQRGMAVRLAETVAGWRRMPGKQGCDILEIGCGTGNLTEMMVRQWPDASITALDLAPAMIEAARQRVGSDVRPGQPRFVQADIEVWVKQAPPSAFDLIVSNACFQWLSDPESTLVHLRRLLRPGGLLIFMTFGPDTFRELHTAFREAYRAGGLEQQRHGLTFRPVSEWQSLLQQAGFSILHCERSIQEERYASVRDFLHSVKAMGASASEASSHPRLVSRRLFADMFEEYEARYRVQGGVAATYDILQIQAGFGN